MDILAYVQITPLGTQGSPLELLNKIIAYSILFAFVSAVFYILWGGFKFIFSGGDDGKMKQATSTIRHAIIGLIIVILAVFSVYVVGQIFGLDIGRHLFNYDEIITDIREILDGLSGNGSMFGTNGSKVDYTFDNNL